MGSYGDRVSSKKVVFVTVGTTLFDTLVKAVDALEVKQDLYAKGYTHLLIQIGRGSNIPLRVPVNLGPVATLSSIEYVTTIDTCVEGCDFVVIQSSGGDGSIAVDYFTFSSTIAESLRSTSLVISHLHGWSHLQSPPAMKQGPCQWSIASLALPLFSNFSSFKSSCITD
ncbi:hypothetical protein Cgig2_026109 [Carnegiea gigantea]|uniref:Uncharacterized protein n=1 Tax=Carnegiea gigantea TaxID=171969 RepID=A0A9Q1GL17_9CARY|nr:hypothetical protein Cgig2_011128 [Carnegiea gigantea]KAJ8423349.1 hypothetical protein Cgig2_026109 [Carnegiea gigantea]